jgi:hypothetical protein
MILCHVAEFVQDTKRKTKAATADTEIGNIAHHVAFTCLSYLTTALVAMSN